ncbi:MAG: MFS transporter [Proteobacteria bacterium]|nr:MFS transporter [Pseudomonadota bacterium]MBI3499428.1 MFS transporter [Pseudomonadota bacterium]
MKKNIKLLYGFSFFDQFMIVIPLLVPYLATKGIGMGQFMELQAVFALVIVCGQMPTGLLSDVWGRKKTLLLGSILKAASFSLLPLWDTYEGFLLYHLTMGIALSMISGGDVAFVYESYLAAGGEKSRGTAVLGNAKLAAQIGTTVSALIGGAVVILSYGHLLWANAVLSWIPVILVLGLAEPQAGPARGKIRAEALKTMLSTTLVRDAAIRLVLLNMVAWGTGGLVMFWVNQKYWQESGVPLAYFGVLLAGYGLILGLAGRSAALLQARYGRRRLLAAVGVLPIVAYFAMASFFGWGGILAGAVGQVGRGLGEVLFLNALNERISSAFRATVISMAQMGIRGAFFLLGPLVGYGIDGWGLPSVLSALGILFSIALVFLLLPLILREPAPSPAGSTKDA